MKKIDLISGMSPRISKASRALVGFTQHDLASAAGIAPQTVADFERGARQPHEKNVALIKATFEKLGITYRVNNGVIVGITFDTVE